MAIPKSGVSASPREYVEPRISNNLPNLLWLFTKSDILIFIVPDTAFGVLSALSGLLLTTNSSLNQLAKLRRTPLVILYVWSNVLVFELANRRLPAAVIEDSHNKPWRPLPAGLISPAKTRRLLSAALPLFLVSAYMMDVWKEMSLLYMLTWMYNDLGGGVESYLIRNLIIAAAFGLYNEGALRIASGAGHSPNERGAIWIDGSCSSALSSLQQCISRICRIKSATGQEAGGQYPSYSATGLRVGRLRSP